MSALQEDGEATTSPEPGKCSSPVAAGNDAGSLAASEWAEFIVSAVDKQWTRRAQLANQSLTLITVNVASDSLAGAVGYYVRLWQDGLDGWPRIGLPAGLLLSVVSIAASLAVTFPSKVVVLDPARVTREQREISTGKRFLTPGYVARVKARIGAEELQSVSSSNQSKYVLHLVALGAFGAGCLLYIVTFAIHLTR